MADEGPITDSAEALDRAIAVLEQQRAVLGDEVTDTALRPLREKRDRLASRPVERRKLVTSLFSDVVDSTPLTARLGAETMRDVLSRYFGEWRTAIEAEGGVVEKFIGDAVVAVFGMARSHEDDPHRAVRAALRMQEPLARLDDELQREHGVGLRMRVGIDTGEVVLGAVGERGDDDIVVVGESLNRAARLQSAAPAGGILLSADTARHVRGAFALQRLDATVLKGIGPVDVYLVHSHATQSFWPRTQGIEGVSTRTVGRDVELGRLRKAFSDMTVEECWTVVTVLGEAGIGKTRVLAEFETWLAGLPSGVWLLRGRATPNGEARPYALLRSVFAERLGLLETDGPDVVRSKWRAGVTAMAKAAAGDPASSGDADVIATWLGFAVGDLPQLDAWRSDPQGLQRRARRALDDLLHRMSAAAPVVLLLEDLHWADDATLDWLHDTGSAAPGYRLLVVGSARPTLLERRPQWGEGLPAALAVRLGPLSRRESGELVADVLQRVTHLPESLQRLVVDAGEGNPFFIEELIAWQIDQGVIHTGGDRWSVTEEVVRTALPTTLRGVLQARLDALEDDERDLTERASVIGRVFWDRAVSRLAGRDETGDDDAYRRLRSREVVHQRPTSTFEHTREFSFRHALLRDTAYDGLLRPRRRRYHRLAAQWMQEAVAHTGRADEHAATIAQHLLEAGERGAAAQWLLRAGRHAAESYAAEQALVLLRQAEGYVARDEPGLRFEVLAEQERVLSRMGRRGDRRAVLDAMTAAAGADPVRRCRLLAAEALWLFHHSDYAAAVSVAREAAELAVQSGRTDLEVQALVLAGRSLAFLTDHEAARRYLQEILPRSREVGSRRDVAEILRLLGVVATNLHEDQEGVAVLGESIEEFRAAADLEGEALATGQLGALLLLTGRLDAAREKCEAALAIFVTTGHRLRQGIVLGNLVSIAMDQGRLDEALRLGQETLELTEDLDDPEGVVSTLQRLGDAARLTGDLLTSRRRLERSVRLGDDHELHYFVAFAHFSLVLVDLAEHDVAAAGAHAEAGGRAARRSDVPAAVARAVLVEGLVRRAGGDPAGAVGPLERALARHAELALVAETRECQAWLATALLEAGRTEEAGALGRELAAAIVDDDEPHGGFEPGRAILECHRVLSAVGDPAVSAVARAARRFLDHRASLIADPVLRRSFLARTLNQQLAAIAET